jgi:sulfofructose kinase
MPKKRIEVDVLCVGQACYDLVFTVSQHPQADEKIFADDLLACGGGPAANAAVAISRLGASSAFAGYLGQDLYGEMHFQEFINENVDTRLIVRSSLPTPLSTILVKPDGKRALINYQGSTKPLSADALDFSTIKPKAILFDGHQPQLSLILVEFAQKYGIPTVLDAGSLHEGTSKLLDRVDYLVTSEKFACQFAGDIHTALHQMSEKAPTVVITLGDKGLIWQRGGKTGSLAALPVNAIDTTGAGDAFHGAFAAAVAKGMDWLDILIYSSVAGALCCTKIGARQGLPGYQEHAKLVAHFKES